MLFDFTGQTRGGRQFPSLSNPRLWRYLLESEHSLFQLPNKGAHPTSKLGCLPSRSVSSKISKGNRANKYVERVCSVCGKRQNNPPRTYAQSIAIAPTLGIRTRGCISLIFFHRPSVSTEAADKVTRSWEQGIGNCPLTGSTLAL